MKSIKVTLAFHNRVETLSMKVTETEWADKNRLRCELETQPRVVAMEEAGECGPVTPSQPARRSQ